MHSLLQLLICLSFIVCLSLSPTTASAILPNPMLSNHSRLDSRQYDRPKLGNVPYGPIISTCSIPGTVALTFDDGPSPFTPLILDHLSAHSAHATFFLNGDNYGGIPLDSVTSPYASLLHRIISQGHQIGSHGYAHVDHSSIPSSSRFSDLAQLEEALTNVLGFYPTYFRPPFASCNGECHDVAGEMGYHVVNFDVDTKDYENDTPEQIGASMDRFAGGTSGDVGVAAYIVLAHDVYEQTAETLVPFMLDSLAERGFRAVTVGECLGDERENWYRSG